MYARVFLALLVLAGAAGAGEYRDSTGFSLRVPDGWRVMPDRRTGRIEISGTGGEQAAIWPVFVRQRLDARSAPAVLRKLAPAGVGWSEPQAAAAAALRIRGRAGGREHLAILTWASSSKGNAVFLFTASAPQTLYARTAATFAGIFASFRVAASNPALALRWVRWRDPRENAFSIEVPEGWKTQGGLFRFASVDTRGAWETVSPDGAIRVAGGDPELPTFTEPNQMLMMAGFREGSWYSPGYGVRMMVRRYLPGALFSREYAAARGAPGCTDVRIAETRERPDAVAALNAIYAQQMGGLGVSIALAAGESAFTCRGPAGPMNGYYFAGTQRVQSAGMPGGIWNAEYLCGFLASPDKTALAQAVMHHILGSIQINPQWAAMQQNITASTSRIVSRTSAEISNITASTYWNRQRVMDEIDRRRSNAILGVVDVVDPVTGRELKVENGSNYYWIDQRGTIAGTDTDTRPNLDFRELIARP